MICLVLVSILFHNHFVEGSFLSIINTRSMFLRVIMTDGVCRYCRALVSYNEFLLYNFNFSKMEHKVAEKN